MVPALVTLGYQYGKADVPVVGGVRGRPLGSSMCLHFPGGSTGQWIRPYADALIDGLRRVKWLPRQLPNNKLYCELQGPLPSWLADHVELRRVGGQPGG
jgi:hypothetical protein